MRKHLRKSGGYGMTLGLTALILALITLTCCGKATREAATPSQAATPAPESSVTIRVSGAWALYPMMVRWGEEYQKLHPGLRVDISAGGAGKGAADALAGLVDLGMISRDIKPEEVSQGAAYVPVVKDAVFPTINEKNPMLTKGLLEKGVKRQTLVDLFLGGKPLTWGGIAGTDAKETVQVYTRSDSCGAGETWARYLGGKSQEELKGVGVYGDPGLAEAVRRDAAGIGFNNLNYAFDMKTGAPLRGIVVLPIDVNENGVIDPSEVLDTKTKAVAAVQTGAYPSPPARDLYLMTKGNFKGATRDFVRWILTDGQKFLDEVGFIKLPDSKINDAIETLGH